MNTSERRSEFAIYLRPLTAEAFAPYGDVIEPTGTSIVINGGKTLRFNDLGDIDPGENGKTIASIFRSTPTALPFAVEKMERHPLGCQAFMPLDRRPYIVIVAPAGPFNSSNLKAFRANGTQGVNFRKGTWHHFNLALEAESQFLVVERSGPELNLEEVVLEQPVVISAAVCGE